jgi:hypothetical protein
VDHLPAMCRWLADPDVATWWREADPGVDAISRKYMPMIAGER